MIQYSSQPCHCLHTTLQSFKETGFCFGQWVSLSQTLIKLHRRETVLCDGLQIYPDVSAPWQQNGEQGGINRHYNVFILQPSINTRLERSGACWWTCNMMCSKLTRCKAKIAKRVVACWILHLLIFIILWSFSFAYMLTDIFDLYLVKIFSAGSIVQGY